MIQSNAFKSQQVQFSMFSLQARESEGMFCFERSTSHYKLIHTSFYDDVLRSLKEYFERREEEYQFIDVLDFESECDYVLLEENEKSQQRKRHENFLSTCYDYINKQKRIVEDLKFQPDYFKC